MIAPRKLLPGSKLCRYAYCMNEATHYTPNEEVNLCGEHCELVRRLARRMRPLPARIAVDKVVKISVRQSQAKWLAEQKKKGAM